MGEGLPYQTDTATGNIRDLYTVQGVVTFIGPVEPFPTGIKMKLRDQHVFCTKSSDQGAYQRGDKLKWLIEE